MKILTFDVEEWFHCDFISGDENWSNYEVRIHKNTDFILEPSRFTIDMAEDYVRGFNRSSVTGSGETGRLYSKAPSHP